MRKRIGRAVRWLSPSVLTIAVLAWTAPGMASIADTVGGPAAQAPRSEVEELALVLRTDALASEEPLGTTMQCGPYHVLFPESALHCTRIDLPLRAIAELFAVWGEQHEGFVWMDGWEPAPLPDGLEAGTNESVRRTLTSADGREYVVAIFDLARDRHIVVAAAPE